MADDTLCIGDVVCLYSAESYGFVYSCQSSSLHSEVGVALKQDKQKPDFKDQNVLSFEVCVANRYKLNKDYRKHKSKIEDDPNNYTLRSRLHQKQLAAKAETDDNELEQKRQQGKKLLYGQIIQLKHSFTLKYIHVSTTTTSPTESNNMAVELREYDAKHAQFKVMPRYKVKAEGDVVQVDDQIVFESIKSSGQYLHVSKTLLGGLSVYQKSYELNLSVQQSGFTVMRKFKPSPDDAMKVKVGDIVRFYHKEMEAYLVAEGLFDDELTEDVHLRLRPVDQSNPKTLFPSSSAVTYWQVELQEGCVAGGVLKWEHQCRLLHMCTRKYLCVDAGGNVTLTTDHLDPRNVFRLHPVIRESDDIPEDSYCRMEHVVSGSWLHACMEEYKKKQEETVADSKSMGSLKWSSAQLRKIGVIDEKQYDDAYTIQSVDQPLEEIFNFMAGMVPFIQKVVADKKAGVVLNAKMSHNIITALKEMAEYMVVDGEPIKQRQKLMRNLRIVELLVSLLKSNINGADQFHMTRIFSQAYNVLYTYLMGNSRKNELYIAKYIDFFLTQFQIKEGGIGLSAAHMVMELIRDNRKIVDRITHDHIDRFVELLRRDKNYRYLDLLSVLCVCDGVSIADNQKYITEVWLMKGMNSVFLTDLGRKIGKDPDKVYVSTNSGKDWIDLNVFANRIKDRDKQDDDYLFLEHQLELFGYLCHGQNSYSIRKITQELDYLSWDEAFMCLSDDRLPDQLRAMYCDLIITMFVDIADNHSVVDRVKLSYVYDDVDNEENRTDTTQSQTYKYFPSISHWISQFLAKNGDMTASLIGNNMLVRQVLRLVYYLVLFGFYDKSEDITKLLEPLMSLLDGRNDKPYPKCESASELEMLEVFRASERFNPSPETKAIVEAKVQALEVLDLFFNFIFNIRLEKFINLFKMTNQNANQANGSGAGAELAPLMFENYTLEENQPVARLGMRKLTEIFEITSFLKNYEIVEILMDLSHYEYEDMVRKSMHLLNRYYSAHNNLFRRAVQAQVLITDASVKIYKDLEDKLPVLRRLSSNKLGDREAQQLADILDCFIHYCHLDGEEEEPHSMNQSILYNNGIIEDAFTILSQEIDVKLLDQYTGLRQVFVKTFVLLKRLARENKTVQERLFDRLDLLLSKEGAAPELSEALTEVFTGNSKTCMKIAQHQVQKIMALVAEHKSYVPQFLDLLNAVVKVEELDLPLKRNQGFVMTYFMQFRTEVAYVIDQDEKSREGILTSSDSKDLNYLISMVDLLATCAEGENRFIESICQTIFKIPELLKVLNNPNISDNLKRPFLRFFLWVYLNTASGMIESGAGDIPHDPAMWGYLTSLSGTLVTVTEYCRNNPEIVKQLLKKPPAKSNSSERGVDRSEQTRGSLHYLFDAVMPFLQIFCRYYYQIDQTLHPNEPSNMDALATNFKNFLETIAPLVSIERQMQSLISCMSVLFSTATLDTEEMEEFQDRYGQGVSGQDVRSDARKDYEDYYQGEEEINTQLNVFAVNMKVAYGGINDVQTQIGFPCKNAYSEMGGDEELPLGAEFQMHINSFINPLAKSHLERYKIAEKLIKQLAISTKLTNLSEKERIEQLELDIKCLQLLRGLLHNEIVKLPEDFENQIRSCQKQLKVIEDVQNALNHYECIDGILEHLSRQNDDVVRELLAFLSALLFNGNENVQKKILDYFNGTREEAFFFAVKKRITLSTIATRERRVLQAMHQAKIEEAIAQSKALKKAMETGNLAKIAVTAVRKNLVASMMSMRQSMVSLSSGQNRPKARGNRGRPGANLTPRGNSNLNGSTKNLGLPSPGTNTLNVPNGLEMQTLGNKGGKAGSKVSFGPGGGVAKNQIVPAIEIEAADDDELEALLEQAGEMPELEFRDDGYIELVLRILGLMCDNQHGGLQNYLREQPDNIKSVNLVGETTKFLQILYSNINKNSINLITQVFETLVEFTSGNGVNQAVVFDNKICDYVNHILRVGVYKDCSDEEVYSLKRAIGILVRCLTEENPKNREEEPTTNLPKEVMEYLDVDVLVNTMTEAWKQYMGQDAEDLETLLVDVGFQYYHLIARKLDLEPHLTREIILKTEQHNQAFTYYSDSTLSIEIIKDDVLQKIYFRVKDKKVLREEIKEKFKYEADRTSPSNKIRDFMDWAGDIIKDIKYQRRVHANPIGRLLVNAWLPLNYIVMLITLAIALLICISWESGSSTKMYIPAYRYSGASIVIYVLGGIHNFLSLGIFVSYVISNRPTFPSFADIISICRKSNKVEEDDDGTWIEKKGESHLEVKAYGFKTIYYVLFLGCSIAGTFTDGYFFAFHLLHITELNQLLKRVIQAVTTNGKSLMLVALLGIAIFYIYSLILFAFYRDWMWDHTSGRHCRTIYECFVSVLHHGLVEGPYTQFESNMGDNFNEAIGIAFFDVSFFIIITTIGLNIIFGIIVDTFSQLRDSKWEIDKDMLNNCFICSRESYDFERQGGGFQRHVKTEHYQWAYLFFFIHLDETRPNDYSALELYVYKMLMVNNFDFFPLNRALSLENEEDSNEMRMEHLQSQIDFLVSKMKEQEAELLREKEKRRQAEWEKTHKNKKQNK